MSVKKRTLFSSFSLLSQETSRGRERRPALLLAPSLNSPFYARLCVRVYTTCFFARQPTHLRMKTAAAQYPTQALSLSLLSLLRKGGERERVRMAAGKSRMAP